MSEDMTLYSMLSPSGLVSYVIFTMVELVPISSWKAYDG